MNKLMTLSFLGMLIGSMPVNIVAAAEPIADEIILKSNVGSRFKVSTEVAELSTVIKRRIKDLPEKKTIRLPNITTERLSLLTSLMQQAHNLQQAPFAERLKMLSDKIKMVIARRTRLKEGADELDEWEQLLDGIDYLNIEILKGPLADGMIEYIHTVHRGDKEEIENIIFSLPVSQEWKGILAKYWYLKYGANKNYILEDENIDYGFSIEELAAYNKVPQIKDEERADPPIYKVLDLSDLRINDLTGLTSIPNIASIEDLDISHNKLTKLPQKIFDPLKILGLLDLSYNNLTTLPNGIFDPLNNLTTLILTHNKLETLPHGIFDNSSIMQAVYLGGNKLAELPETIFNRSNNLSLIDLADNMLTRLPEKIFANLSNLNRLWLSHNLLTTLPKQIFGGLNSLEELHLDNNKINTLPDGIFDGLPKNIYLVLADNEIIPEQIAGLRKRYNIPNMVF